MKNKKNNEKKAKAVAITLKILNGIVYAYALILTIMLVVGSFSSKKKQKSVNIEESQQRISLQQLAPKGLNALGGNYENYQVLSYAYEDNEGDGLAQYTFTEFDHRILPIPIPPNPPSGLVETKTYDLSDYDFRVFGKSERVVGGTRVLSISFQLKSYPISGSSSYNLRISKVYFTLEADAYHDYNWDLTILNYVGTYWGDDMFRYVQTGYNDLYICSPYACDKKLVDESLIKINYFFAYRDMVNFHIDTNPYVNIGLGYSSNNVACSTTGENPPNVSGGLFRYYLWVGDFISNDNIYNCMAFTYYAVPNDQTVYVDVTGGDPSTGGHELKKIPANTYVFVYAHYCYATGTFGSQSPQVDWLTAPVVLQRDSYMGTDNYVTAQDPHPIAYQRTCTWTLASYQVLDILGANNKGNYHNALNNLSWLNHGYNTSTIGNVTLGDVFEIIALAFTGIVALFNVVILPGITIGYLIFLPLVVSIIIIVVRLVKK